MATSTTDVIDPQRRREVMMSLNRRLNDFQSIVPHVFDALTWKKPITLLVLLSVWGALLFIITRTQFIISSSISLILWLVVPSQFSLGGVLSSIVAHLPQSQSTYEESIDYFALIWILISDGVQSLSSFPPIVFNLFMALTCLACAWLTSFLPTALSIWLVSALFFLIIGSIFNHVPQRIADHFKSFSQQWKSSSTTTGTVDVTKKTN